MELSKFFLLAQTRKLLRICVMILLLWEECDVRTSVQTKHQQKWRNRDGVKRSSSPNPWLAHENRLVCKHRGGKKRARNSHISSPWLWWFSNSCHFIFAIISRHGIISRQKTKVHFVQNVCRLPLFICEFFYLNSCSTLIFQMAPLTTTVQLKNSDITTCSLWASSSGGSHQKHTSRCWMTWQHTRRVPAYGKMRIFSRVVRFVSSVSKRQNCKHK